jgi:proteasome lid subunit RPN8/RPN11
MPPSKIQLHNSHLETMLSDVIAQLPREACGLVGGKGEQVKEIIPITNVMRSATRYRMDPREQIAAMARFEDLGFDLLGIYHSHVAGPRGLSQTDVEEMTYPDSAYLVWSNLQSGWECHAFILMESAVLEIPLTILDVAT